MQPTLAFAPTPDDLDEDLFTVPILTFAPPPADDTAEED